MKKEGFVFLIVIAILILVVFVESEISIEVYGNITGFQNLTYPDAKITGKINLSVSGVEKGINLSSNQGDSLDFYNFSEKQGYSIECYPEDCSNNYETTSEGSQYKTISLSNGSEIFLGFYLKSQEEIRDISSISLNLTSNFSEEDSCPLKIDFFENERVWSFNEFSNTSYSAEDYGNYNLTNEDNSVSRVSDGGMYCMEYDFYDLRDLKVGAEVRGTGSTFMKMKLYDSNTDPLGECYFKPVINENSCLIEVTSEKIEDSKGPYYVCNNSNTTTLYDLSEESTSENKSGFFIDEGDGFYINDEGMDKNYAIFIKKAKYANSTKINNSDFSGEDFSRDALNYLSYKYDNNCSGGCIIPIKISSGTNQKLNVSLEDFTYKDSSGFHSIKNISLANQTKAQLIFNDVIDLSKTNFRIKDEGDYILSIGTEEILNKKVEFKDSYRITSLVPQQIPENALTDFLVFVEGNPTDLTYYWNFSDDTFLQSDTYRIQKIFTTIGNYTVYLRVVDEDGVEGFNEFDLEVVLPTDKVVNKSYTNIKNTLDNFEASLDSFSRYKEDLKKAGNLSDYKDELTKIAKYINDSSKNNSEILNALNKLKIPQRVLITTYDSEYIPSSSSIKEELVVKKADRNVSSSDLSKYKEQILSWENTYMQAQIISKDIKIRDIYGEEKTVITDYSINAFSDYSDGKSYLVIDIPRINLSSLDSSNVKSVSNGTFIEFKNNVVDFYVLEGNYPERNIFFSTDLDDYNIAGVSECNNNGVCEKSSGENSSNCRADCKPIDLIVVWLIVISILGVGIFFGLRAWFKKNYEKKLFSNPRDLDNLMRFVRNAKKSNLSRAQTKKELLEAGWSIDRINYAIKKTFKNEDIQKKGTPIKEPKKSRNINKSKKV